MINGETIIGKYVNVITEKFISYFYTNSNTIYDIQIQKKLLTAHNKDD